jgi:hypothetical protein
MDYNPHSPRNIGMEWVPIQQANFVPDNLNEFGYMMRLDQSATVVSGGIGINVLPPQIVANISEGVSIYPAASAVETGPVRMVTIPVQSGTITGSARIFTLWGDPVATALAYPNDENYVQFFDAGTVSTDGLGLNFGVTAFANELSGKRIVQLRLIYTAASDDTTSLGRAQVGISRSANTGEGFTYQSGIDGFVGVGAAIPILALNTDYNYVVLGDWNPVWAPGMTQFTTDTIFPWRYNELANLDTATPINVRQQIVIFPGSNVITFQIGYLALQVFYCEETRVAYGGRRPLVLPNSVGYETPLKVGENRVPIRSTAYVTSTVLSPGLYTVTATHRSVSNFGSAKLPPTYAAIRQLNETIPVLGEVIKPTIVIDDEFVLEETDVITDISLYTAVAAVTGTHVYANQLQAPVYGTITATQDIVPSNDVKAATAYAQVRFYARRFGDTIQPLVISLSGGSAAQSASITPDAFDALPEIFDGWREVTLTFGATVPATAGTVFAMIWSAAGETAGNQWQVLGATAFTSTPNSNVSTYNPPVGSTAELTWKSPNVTVSTLDAQSDATIILAQNSPSVSGFAISSGSMAVSGIGEECGVPNDCIPTDIAYNQLAWVPIEACETFDVDATQWSVLNTDQTWVLNGGTTASEYPVSGGVGYHVHSVVNTAHRSWANVGSVDQTSQFRFKVPSTLTGASAQVWSILRLTDVNNFYWVQAFLDTTQNLSVQIGKYVAGAPTTLSSFVTLGKYAPEEWLTFDSRVQGSLVQARIGRGDNPDPEYWQLSVTDTSLTTGLFAGVLTTLEAGVTNALPYYIAFDDFTAAPVTVWGSTLEIQRQDDETDWQTIVQAEPCFSTLKDLEARVGMESRYRARICDSLDFCGPWVTGAGTIATPGVTIGGDGSGVLIFTSNRDPDASLAYTMGWQGRPVETFVFPEADTQTLQRMYGRDFQVAFRPLERGGEVFERVILVQAAAIPVPSLANFHSLRDLAWADLPYVCVRDELGNRWFANVLVPTGDVRSNRRLYLAQIRVTEVTDTAAPVLEAI